MLDDHFPEPEDERPGGDTTYFISVEVNVPGAVTESATRAAASPMDYDDYIDVSSFHLFFYNNRNEAELKAYPITCFHPIIKEEVNASSKNSVSSKGYYLKGYIKTLPKVAKDDSWDFGYKSYMYTMLANLPDLKGKESGMNFASNDNLSTSIHGTTTMDSIHHYYSYFSWPAGTVPSEARPIPMYTWMSSSSSFAPDENGVSNFTAVDLLRAVGRIIVRSNTELSDVKLLRGNTYGLAVPKNPNSTTNPFYPGNVYGSLGDNYLTIPGDNSRYSDLDPGRVDSIPFTVIPKKGSDKYKYNYILYVPEYRNVGVEEADTTGLVFKFDGRDYHIPFGTYSDEGEFTGTRLNINRNYSYEYILSLAPYKIQYSVRPWDEEVAGEITFN
jgi:hypothetical protein